MRVLQGFSWGMASLSLLLFEVAPGWSGDNIDDLLTGFEEGQEEVMTLEDDDSFLPDWLGVTGIMRVESTLSINHDSPPSGEPDYRGLSMLRGSMEVITDWDRWGLKGRLACKGFYDLAYRLTGERELYSEKYLGDYEREFELGEAYIQGSLRENIDVKIGRQVVVWGKADTLRVTDILNPLDSRLPGLVDIRDLKLPVTMTRLDTYFGEWNFSTTLVHEPRFDKIPVYNGDFFPGNRPGPKDNKPGMSLENQQLGLALNGIFSGWDFSFYGASVFDKRGHLEMTPTLVREHERVLMLGYATNVALGNWLLKSEGAYWHGLKFSLLPNEEKSRLDLLAAFEYQGFTDTVISFELVNRHFFDFDARLKGFPIGQKQDQLQYALRFVRDFYNDTLHFTLLNVSQGLLMEDGGFTRCQVEYDVVDALSVTGGVVLYTSGDIPFQEIGDNDRIFMTFEYHF